MKNKIVQLFFLIALIFFVQSANATIKIDEKRVYNPTPNSCIKSFNGKISEMNHDNQDYNLQEIQKTESVVLNWISGTESPFYLKDFDQSKFHWQFIDNKIHGGNKIGVVLILPYNSIREDFYEELGGGLEIPGTRCYGVDWTWLNDGEVFSFVVDKENFRVEEFVNWRFEQTHPDFNPMLAYYSEFIVNYKTSVDLKKVNLLHFVDGNFRSKITVSENEKILFPKGKISTLVFYVGNSIKGMVCFDMSMVNVTCPMHYETTVYLKDRLGYDKVLYAKPRCEGIYAFEIIEKPEFEKLTTLKWSSLLEWNETIMLSGTN